MADAAAAQHDDTIVGEPSLGTIDATMADAADAAAAATLVALPQPTAAAAGEFIAVSQRCTALYKLKV